MAASNWLVQYRDLEGIDQAIKGVARRATFKSEMASAIEDLKEDYALYESDFRKFFPLLSDHAGAFLAHLISGENQNKSSAQIFISS